MTGPSKHPTPQAPATAAPGSPPRGRMSLLLLAASVLPALLLAATAGGCTTEYWFGKGKDGAEFSRHVDPLYMFIYWLSVVCFIGITAATVWLALKYRRTPKGPNAGTEVHNTTLEIVWSVGPSIILVFVFYYGFVGFMDMRRVPLKEAYEIEATAYQWGWSFRYPNGLVTDMGTGLYVPADTPVRIILKADDVMHAFFIPAFRVKMDAVPGRFNRLWFKARVGTYDLQCAEYCGKSHSQMNAKVYVLPRGEFDKKLDDLDVAPKDKSPADYGKDLYAKWGCGACHSVDGSAKTGPTWAGLYGRERRFTSGEKLAPTDPDYERKFDQYIRESILAPAAKVVEGFPPSMPSFAGKLSEKSKNDQVGALLAYIRTLKQ